VGEDKCSLFPPHHVFYVYMCSAYDESLFCQLGDEIFLPENMCIKKFKMPEFYTISARKIFFSELWGRTNALCLLLPTFPTSMCAVLSAVLFCAYSFCKFVVKQFYSNTSISVANFCFYASST